MYHPGMIAVSSPDFLRLVRAVAHHRSLKVLPALPDVPGPAGTTLVKMAERHKVLEALQTWSTVHPEILEPEATRLLKTQALTRKVITRQIVSEWVKITQAFRQEGIPLVGLKGPALSQILYGSPTSRESRDLDFIVESPRNLQRVHRVMKSLGYEPQDYFPLPVGRVLEQYYLKFYHHVAYGNPSVPFCVEIHNRTWKTSLEGFPLEAGPLVATAEVMEAQGKEVLVPRRGWHLAYMVSHGTSHGWCLLHWVADLAALWTHMDQATEEEFFSSVRTFKVESQLSEALRIAGTLFSLPERTAWPLPLPASSDFSRFCLDYLVGNKPYQESVGMEIHHAYTQRFHMKADRSFLTAVWFMPRPWAMEALKLPPAWQFLHFILGPFFLSYRVLRRALSRLGLARQP